MITETDLSNGFVHGTENSLSRLKQHVSVQNLETPDGKIGFSEKGSDFLRGSEIGHNGFPLKPSRNGNSGAQELTLSYLCDNSKMDFQDKDISGKNLLSSLEKGRYKGKEVVPENQTEEERWVERDFLQLTGARGAGSRREFEEEEIDRDKREKKPKIETLNLSLALPVVSLSLNTSNPAPKADPPVHLKSVRSTHSLAPSSSDDYTAASRSYSYSLPFSHNPSCSLTRNSTENYEYSMGSHRRETDQFWNCGEGTNGSVHSRFRPFGDGVGLSNHGGGFSHPLMQGGRPINKDSCNSLYRTTSSDNHSFFPSELLARPRKDTLSANSRGRASEQQIGLENSDGGRARKLTSPERILREIVSESIPIMAQILHELPDETIESTKECLKGLIEAPEKREELAILQTQLEKRSDLTFETLSKSNKAQLDILVTVKTGLVNYLSGKNRLPTAELVEIFLFMRCRNPNCKSLLPVDDCDCKICSTKKGFCSSCMCPVCLKFDCANNTCSWVGCDVCSHWCHAICGLQKNLIKPGPSLKGPKGSTEMQFHCVACGHASEMFGFIKDVFMHCAKDWGIDTLIKELECVRNIFRGSEDVKGKELQTMAMEMLSKLENKIIVPSDAYDLMLQFFQYGSISEIPASKGSSQELMASQLCQSDVVSLPPPTSLSAKPTTYNSSSSIIGRDLQPCDVHCNGLKSNVTVENELRSGMSLKDGFDSLEGIVRIKEMEARMFQSKADEARREAEEYRRIIQAKTEKLEEEYTNKLSKLCLKETEERRRKKLEELKLLENSHCDYYKLKVRMQAEIAGLLERMEKTKQMWV